MLKGAFPYALLVLFMSIYQRIDGLMLEPNAPKWRRASRYLHFHLLEYSTLHQICLSYSGTTLLPLFQAFTAKMSS
ncbi:MAG: hypothetical protein IPK03_17290 [Bacteroidetes bacterium]|nr:hypothetical protein [Bacteroidota bacterium]